MKRPASALWLVHKPVGVTSASLVEDFRKSHAGNFSLKVSHGGVLDPFAEGLVVLLVGAANRLFEALHEVPKTYVARLALGVETDTGDAGGREVSRADASGISVEQVEAALQRFVGWTEQVPPATSNKRVGGERAYEKAHRGEAVVLPAQRVFLQSARVVRQPLSPTLAPLARGEGERGHSLSLRERGEGRGEGLHFDVELSVRGGFYVRSLAVDLGRALGCGAHVVTLHRTAIGPYLDPRVPVEQRGRDVLPWLPSLELSDAEWGALRQGTAPTGREPLPPTWLLPSGFPNPSAGVRVFHQGRLVALVKDGAATLLPGGV